MSVRQFKLINSIGQEKSLMSEDLFGHTPTGLGASFSNAYYGVNSNFINESLGVDQQVFEIQIVFGHLSRKPYLEYNEFMQFLNHQPITVEYSLENLGTFRRDANVSEITKTEIGDQNVLNETFAFEFFTPFYSWVEFERKKTPGTEGGKKYNYTYDYTYGIADAIFNTIELNNDSVYFGTSYSSPLEIKITATQPISNPQWEIVQNGQIVQNDRFFVDLQPGYSLLVSSDPQNQRAVIIDPYGNESNVYMKQDIQKSNFVVAPLGKSTLEVLGSGFDVYVRMRKEWLVV